MNTVTTLFRLAAMRRSIGAGPVESVTWAAGLVWRSRASRRVNP